MMSMAAGETEQSPSGFTVDTLRFMLEALTTETDKRYEQRFKAQEGAVEAAFAAAKEATAKADAASEKRFDSINEFRGQLSDQAATFMPRNEADAKISSLSEKLVELTNRVNLMTGRDTGMSDSWKIGVAIITIIIACSAVAVSIIVAAG